MVAGLAKFVKYMPYTVHAIEYLKPPPPHMSISLKALVVFKEQV